MSRGFLVLLACAPLALAMHGCSDVECGQGTLRYGDTCVVTDPFDRTPPKLTIDPPLYTRAVGTVRITSDEPAVIYYTVDGSEVTTDSPSEPDQVVITDVADTAQLRAFAVDLAGNRSEELTRLWIIDRAGPPAPIDFHVTVVNQLRTVNWTAPTDPRFGGVIVARVEGTLSAAPTAGKVYAVGDTIAPGLTVVAQSTMPTAPGTFDESRPVPPGMVRYVAWAYDAIYNYGPPAGDYVLIPVPQQTGKITVSAASPTITATQQPANITLAGTTTLAGSTLTAKLAIRNNTTRVLFAPKVAVTSTITGVSWTNSDGTVSGHPYRAYGGAIPPDGVVTATLVFTGASGSTNLALDLEITDGPVLVATTNSTRGGELIDEETTKRIVQLGAAPTGRGGRGQTQRGGITPDGTLIVGARTVGAVSAFDLASGQRIATTTLRDPKSHVPHVVLDRSGSAVYALVAAEHPNRINNNGSLGSETELVRLDAATLTENGRLLLGTSRNRGMEISSDGKTLIVATGVTSQGVILVDLPTFTVKTRIVSGFRPQIALFTPDGTSIVVINEQIATYNIATGMRTSTYPTPGTNGKVHRAAFGNANTLWIGRHNELCSIDVRDGTPQVYATVPGVLLMEVFDGKVYTGTFQNGPPAIYRLDENANIDATLGFTEFRGHWMGRSPF